MAILFTDLTDDNFGHVEINELAMFWLSRPRPIIESNPGLICLHSQICIDLHA